MRAGGGGAGGVLFHMDMSAVVRVALPLLRSQRQCFAVLVRRTQQVTKPAELWQIAESEEQFVRGALAAAAYCVVLNHGCVNKGLLLVAAAPFLPHAYMRGGGGVKDGWRWVGEAKWVIMLRFAVVVAGPS